jgi:putative SOS response-associated peptidase YedK
MGESLGRLRSCGLWLDPGFQKTDTVCDLLKPFNPALMRRYEVSSRVNLVKNNDAVCEEPLVRLSAVGM